MGSVPSVVVDDDVYLKGRVFGKGSFGKVYLMKHKATGKNRVFKEMSKTEILKRSTGSAKMLMREREFLSHVHGCPYVIKCYAALQDKDNLYLLMEFCEGGEFQYYLDNNPNILESELKIYLAQMIWGLNKLHTEYKIIHRDIKPDNCLIDEKGMITIIDFGVAEKLDNQGLYVNNENRIAGTMYYMAPEVLEGGNHSAKVDWWSLGILAFEAFHRRKPFICGNTFAEQRQLLNASIVFAPHISVAFQQFLRGLLTINVEQRFGFAEIQSHEFFNDINWTDVAEFKLQASFVPTHGTLYFRKEANMNAALGFEPTVKPRKINESEQQLFDGWDWVLSNSHPISDKKPSEKMRSRRNSTNSVRQADLKETMNYMLESNDCDPNCANLNGFNCQDTGVMMK